MKVSNNQTSQRSHSRPTFSARADDACQLSPTVVAAPDQMYLSEKYSTMDSVLDSSNLKEDQHRQLLSELGSIPSQMWKILGQSGLRIVTLPPGKNLSETSSVRQFAPLDYPQRIQEGRQWLVETRRAQESANQDNWAALPDAEMQQAMWKNQQGPILAESLLSSPGALELGFRVAVARQPVSLDQLREAAQCQEPSAARWLKDFRDLNGEFVTIEGEQVTAPNQVFLLPYPYIDGVPLKPDTLEYLKGQSDRALLAAMGTNYWQSSLVVVHQDFLPDPAPEAGHHRVLLHEVGHAIDHLIERIQNEGLGQHHRQTMDLLFAQDSSLEQQGVARFSSPRAKDNVREYFAEAVESYLTRSRNDAHESKPNNNHDWLKANNPELFAYVDNVFRRHYPENLSLDPLPSQPKYSKPDNLLVRFEKPYLEFP